MVKRTARGLTVGLLFVALAVALGIAGRLSFGVFLAIGAGGTAAIVWAAR